MGRPKIRPGSNAKRVGIAARSEWDYPSPESRYGSGNSDYSDYTGDDRERDYVNRIPENRPDTGFLQIEDSESDTDQAKLISQLKKALIESRNKLEKQREVIEQLASPPFEFGTVVGFEDVRNHEDEVIKLAVVAVKDGVVSVRLPDRKRISVDYGDLVHTVSGNIFQLSKFSLLGPVCTVKKIVGDNYEVTREGVDILVYRGRFSGCEVGERVMLDPTSHVVMRNLGKDKENFQFEGATNVSWEDIGGLADAKSQMIEAIELPHKYADLYKSYNKKPIKGVLLYGPPGCGKTMLGKAAATSIAQLHEANSVATGFMYVKGPEILSKWVGVSEETVRSLFARARKHKEKYGYPAVLFIDEADAILRKRGSGVSSDIESTIVPAFLAEMDGLDENACVVILATNRSDVLDPAVTRDGRIDRAIRITRPTKDTAADIFKIHLRGVPIAHGSADSLAKLGTKELFSPNYVLYQLLKNDNSRIDFTLGHLCNGAMIAGIIDKGTSLAMQRDMKKRAKKPGLTPADIVQAVKDVFVQNLDLNHKDDLADFLEPIRDQIAGVEKLRQSSTT